ncbi:MAG: FtsX-like permease family protein [Pseudomonadales bacterium]|nr:FtsX-like permease family protein [Pseudomonadales bacterium]
MEFGPIWRAALRNKTGILLIVLQVAFTMAIVINSIAIAQERAKQMSRPSGVDEANTFSLNSSGFAADFNSRLTVEEDLRQLRGMPGVTSAVQINAIPLGGSGWSMGLKTKPGAEIESVPTAVYFVDEKGIDALGVKLIAGENFASSDIRWREPATRDWADKIIVTRALAIKLFPEEEGYGVGKVVYINDTEPMTIVGVIDRLQMPWSGWTEGVEQSMLVPEHLVGNSTAYMVRAETGRRDMLMPQVETLLAESEDGRIIRNLRTMEETRKRSYEGNQALINILTVTIAILIGITTLGVAGLTSFNVTRRTKQIGTRRALGASRKAILRYFLAENFLFTAIGVTLGAVLAVGLNMLLVDVFSIPRFSWYLLPLAMLTLVLIGQLAVLVPARRAATVPPAIATRTV